MNETKLDSMALAFLAQLVEESDTIVQQTMLKNGHFARRAYVCVPNRSARHCRRDYAAVVTPLGKRESTVPNRRLVPLDIARIRKAPANLLGRRAGNDRVWRDIFRHHGPGRHDCAPADSYTSQDSNAVPEPGIGFDRDFLVAPRARMPRTADPGSIANWETDRAEIVVVPAYERDSIRDENEVADLAVALDVDVLADIDVASDRDPVRRPERRIAADVKIPAV